MTRFPSNAPPQRGPRCLAAFTLLELLIVISVITILISIVVGVGFSLVRNQKRVATLSVLKALDGALTEFRAETSVIPRYDPGDDNRLGQYARMPGLDIFPGDRENLDPGDANDLAFSEYLGRNHPRRPDASVFLSQALGYGEADQVIQNMPDRFVGVTLPAQSIVNCETGAGEPGDDSFVDCDPAPSVVDAWGDRDWFRLDGNITAGAAQEAPIFPIATQSLIYYIHPSNRLARGLYGDTLSDRPYFLSPGPDGLYGLPEECIDDSDRIICGDLDRTFFKEEGEADDAFKQRVLREIRSDNIASYPVDFTFSVPTAPTDLLNPKEGWKPPAP